MIAKILRSIQKNLAELVLCIHSWYGSVDRRKADQVDLFKVDGEWEMKTITSALKNYFRSVISVSQIKALILLHIRRSIFFFLFGNPAQLLLICNVFYFIIMIIVYFKNIFYI